MLSVRSFESRQDYFAFVVVGLVILAVLQSTLVLSATVRAELVAGRPHLAMHAMDGLLIDEVPLNAIADAAGTPVWVYAASSIRRRYRALLSALSDAGANAHIHYAVKANDRLAVLRLLAAEGAGADVVSEGELRRACQAGIPVGSIVFSGVGKTERELRFAMSIQQLGL